MILNWFQERFGEFSTYSGLFLVASAWGGSFTPEQQIALATLGVALFAKRDKQHS